MSTTCSSGESGLTAAYSIETKAHDDGSQTLTIAGSVTLQQASGFFRDLLERTAHGSAFTIDLAGATTFDGGSIALLISRISELEQTGTKISVVGARPDVARLLSLYECADGLCDRPPNRPGTLQQIGAATCQIIATLRDVLAFVGALTISTWRAIRDPKSVPWRSLTRLLELAGADGAPIVVLINFLIGFILGLQAALQLEKFGANIYIADLVGKSLTRELGPLMTAIVVAGRSGAAYAAELGTMKVSEEVDALRTLGFDPMRYLVIPRVIALTTMVPLLVILGNLVGLLGGLLVGVIELDLTVVGYTLQTQNSLNLWDIGGGLIKASVFGCAIALISCQRGLATRGGAAGVGASTTSAVVTILFVLVSLDALFTVLFTRWEI
ncbi:MAG: MlaE family lipid ABC transporter permease subunit [Planctomycetota bacterium]